MKRAFALVLLVCCATPGKAADRESQIADIREATFRYQFEHNASGQQKSAKVYFISIYDPAEKEVSDPDDEFMKRFSGNHPRVAKGSEAKKSMDEGVRDKKTGEQGLDFHLGPIRWKSEEEVEVDGGYYEAGESASGNTYYLKKRDGHWIVERDEMHWIAMSAPIQSFETMPHSARPEGSRSLAACLI